MPINIGAIEAYLDLDEVKKSLQDILQKNIRIVKNGTLDTTPTSNENTTDIAQMYLEWAASNPNATAEQAFAAGADIALGTNTPIGLGQVDDTRCFLLGRNLSPRSRTLQTFARRLSRRPSHRLP